MVLLVPAETPRRTWRYRLDSIIVWGNRPVILLIRRILWIITAGWWLAVAYVFFGVAMVASLVFIPFVPQALKLAMFAFDTVTLTAVRDPVQIRKPFTVAANVVWAGLFGWSIMLGFVMAAIVQCLTIVGIPTALTLVELATFALLPFGSHIKTRFLPTTVAEVEAHRKARDLGDTEGAPVSRGGDGGAGPLSMKGAPMGADAV